MYKKVKTKQKYQECSELVEPAYFDGQSEPQGVSLGQLIRRSEVDKDVDDEKLKAYVAQNPDAYQAEIAEAIGAKENTVCRALKRLKISRKKRPRSTEKGMKKSEVSI